jgi:hypothetical protein
MILDTLLDAHGRPVFQAPPKSMRAYLVEHWGVFKGVCDVLPWEAVAPVPVEVYVGVFSEEEWRDYFNRPLPMEMTPIGIDDLDRLFSHPKMAG